jgi:hypothetical protein
VPIVALTAHALPSDRVRCLEAGMDGYLSKPFRAGDLMRAIAEVLPVRRPPVVPSVAPASLLGDEISALLVVEYESKLREIGEALASGRLGEVRMLVHRLKGAMALFHTGDPYTAADRLEWAAASGDRPECFEAWTMLSTHLERLLVELHRA